VRLGSEHCGESFESSFRVSFGTLSGLTVLFATSGIITAGIINMYTCIKQLA